MCMELKVTKETLRSILNLLDIIVCVTSSLTRSFNFLPSLLTLYLSPSLQRLGRGLAVCTSKATTPSQTRLWSS